MKYLLVISLLFLTTVSAQELNSKVRINIENIDSGYRDLLSNFASSVEDYMNKTKFVENGWEGGRIDCALDIFFLSGKNEVNYTVQVVVTSQRGIYNSQNSTRMLTVSDNSWSFKYEDGQPFYQRSTSFDPLTSFLDFYAYVIIGLDLDSYSELGGTQYFKKALDIVNFAVTNGATSDWLKTTGIYSRRKLVQELIDERYRPFREGLYDYFYGIDIFSMNKDEGQRDIVSFIEKVSHIKNKIDANSILLKTFFDAKYAEIINKLKDYPDKKKQLLKLKAIDPAHSVKYERGL